jgi:transcriptional regulator with XRE-family HTH domain
MNNIGEILKNKRIAMGLSRDKLARKTDITPRSIISIENGSLPSTRTLLKILDALDLEMKIEDKKEVRTLTDEELERIADVVVQDILNGYQSSYIDVNADLDIEIKYVAEIKQHREDHYESGTGAWIVEDCVVKITNIDMINIDDDIETTPPDKSYLEGQIEEKIMEG